MTGYPCSNCGTMATSIINFTANNRPVHGCSACKLSITGHFFELSPTHCPNGHQYDGASGLHHWCFECCPQASPPEWYKNETGDATVLCQWCGERFLPDNKRGIVPKFCKNACKQANYRHSKKKVVTHCIL